MSEQKLSPKQEIEAKRAARRAAEAEAAAAQEVADLTAIDALEEEHGDSHVAVLSVAYSAGLPTRCACRTPSMPLMKRYRDQVRPRKDNHGRSVDVDYVAPAEMLAAETLIYPAKEVFDRMCDKRPGLAAQLGLAAVGLASAKDEAEGKD